MTDESTALVPRGDPVVVSHPGNANQPQNQVEGAQQQQAPPQEDTWSMIKKMLYRMMIFYLITSLIRGWFQPQQTPPASGDQANLSGGGPRPTGTGKPGRNMFQFGDEIDFFVYISESEAKFQNFNDSSTLFWHLANFKYGDWSSGDQSDGSYTKSERIETTEGLRNNGSLYMHVFVTKSGFHPDPTRKTAYSKRFTYYKLHRLNRYKKKRYQKTQNLLTGKTEQSEEDAKKAETLTAEILSHWHPNLTVNLVTDQTAWVRGTIPPPLDDQIEFENYAGIDFYYPPVFFNDYWNLMADYQPINDTVKYLNFTLTVSPISLFKWQIYAAQTMRNKWSAMFGSSGSTITSLFEDDQDDQDSLKQAMLDTNPYLLGLTIAVSILHTIFEFLAFKNDIQFWRNRKSLEGLSVRSVVFNLFTSIIVFLYILDNETNFVVRLSVGIGVLIDLWKIPKCMDVSLDRDRKWLGLVPSIRIKDKGSYVESSTKQYDMLAFRYLSWVLYPLLVGYAVYSLLYQEHRGWYSWVLSMLYGFLLTFGFIMMTPQLFINYKLKSVAHLPWRMLSYKFLNTFIDDIFAFVIKMPTMYRIGCFRDDIIFLIYLYQRWIYRVDPTRMNEFGTSGELEAEAAANRNRDNTSLAIQQRPEDHLTGDGEDHVTASEENNAAGGQVGRPSNSPSSSTNRNRRRRNEKSGGRGGSQSESASSSASTNHDELSTAAAAVATEDNETKKDK